jgi:hypothetical protein
MDEQELEQLRQQQVRQYLLAGKQPPTELLTKFETGRDKGLFGLFGGGQSIFDANKAISALTKGQQGLLDLAKIDKAETKTETDKANQQWLDLIKAGGTDPQKVYELGKVQQQLEREGLEFDVYRQRLAGDEATRQSTRQLAAAYPYLSAAGREATQRALEASERFLRTKEQMPSKIQDIMASKQQQQLAAQAGEADLMRAVAAQQQAAKQFAGTFAGKYISAG